MQLVHCTFNEHGQAILGILNEAIVTSTALYDYEPRTLGQIEDWFALKSKHNFPVLGLVDDSGEFIGFATYGQFRTYAGYRYTVEHSVYVHRDYRGRGFGLQMMRALMDEAELRQVHVMIGVIDAHNQASIRMHEQLGFTHSGTLREVGYKFDSWLDVVFYHRLLQIGT